MVNLRKWSQTATGNASVAGGANTINFAEGQTPGSVNNSAREMMAQLRSVYTPSEWGWVENSATASVASQTTFKLAGNQTTDWVAPRRWRLKSGSTTRYGTVVSSSYTAETTVTVTVDSGSLSASHSLAALSVIDNVSNQLPAITTTTAGNVGIGGTPSNKLDVFGSVARILGTTPQFLAKDTANAGNAAFTVVQGQDSSGTAQWYVGKTDSTSTVALLNQISGGNIVLQTSGGGNVLVTGTGGFGYGTGSGGAVTQATSRTTAVTLNKLTGVITLFTAAGSATPAQFTVNNNLIGANDTVLLTVVNGTNVYVAKPYNISAGVGFGVNFWASTGTASDTPKINFTIIKGANA